MADLHPQITADNGKARENDLSNRNHETEGMSATGHNAILSSTSSPYPERRNAQRVNVSLEAIWEGMSGRREARVTDLSQHGCFLESCAQTSVGEQVRFLLKSPTERWLELTGEVAFYQPMVGFGIKFMDIDKHDEAMLNELIEFFS